MDVYEALYTTRAMRRVKPDPIPDDVQARILDAAIRAPSGGNMQNWKFMLVDDPGIKKQIAPLYQESLAMLWVTFYKDALDKARATPDDPESDQFLRIQRSAQYLADHFEEYPLLFFSFVQFDPSGGSIFPATWSAMLAARAEGVGSALTTISCVVKGAEQLEILGVPKDEGWVCSSLVTMGYPTGKWGVAPRRPASDVTYRNGWGKPVGLDLSKPLWSG
jgi:nitroreductase